MTRSLLVTERFQRGLAEYGAERWSSAAREFEDVLARAPQHAGALHYLGLIAQASGRLRRALSFMQRSIALAPNDASFAFNLGNLLYALHRPLQAIRAWEAASRLDPQFEDAYRNVGLTAAERGDHQAAAAAFRRALDVNPDSASGHRAYARALRRLGRACEARQASMRAHLLAGDPQALSRFAAARLRGDRVAEGVAALRRAVRLAPDDTEIRYRLARVLTQLNRPSAALRHYRRVLELNPAHPSARFWTRALEGRPVPAPPPEYVADLFDRFSTDYDQHMVERLDYRGPALLWAALRRVLQRSERMSRPLAVLDAGCGTGLGARWLRKPAGRLVGVDLSPGMIAKARALGAYDELVVSDLVRHLESTRRRFDAVFASDVFIYFGELGGLLAAVAGVLKRGGLLAFTVEAGDDAEFVLGPTGRYRHSLAYVRQRATDCRYVVRHTGTGVPRYEGGAPVRAFVMVLEKR
jgi:predicted TPR repeat methyltransferase